MNQRIKVFISYAHEDEEQFKIPLDKCLIGLIRSGKIEIWHDRKIQAGQEWDALIKKEFDESQIILLLVSVDFLNSTYIWENELKQAIVKHELGTAKVIPIIARNCDWSDMPFKHLQCLPANAQPISEYENKDEAYTFIAKEIKAAVLSLIGEPRTENLKENGNKEQIENLKQKEDEPAKKPMYKKPGCSLTFSVVFLLVVGFFVYNKSGNYETLSMANNEVGYAADSVAFQNFDSTVFAASPPPEENLIVDSIPNLDKNEKYLAKEEGSAIKHENIAKPATNLGNTGTSSEFGNSKSRLSNIKHNFTGRTIVSAPKIYFIDSVKGSIVIAVTIDTAGNIILSKIMSSPNLELGRLALEKIASIKFNHDADAPPLLKGNISISVMGTAEQFPKKAL